MSNTNEQKKIANRMTATVNYRGANTQFTADRLTSILRQGQLELFGEQNITEANHSIIRLSFPAHQAVSGRVFKIGEDKNTGALFAKPGITTKATSGELKIISWNPVSGVLNMAFSFQAEEVQVKCGEMSFTIESGNLGSRVEATITPPVLPMGNLIANQISLKRIDADGYLLYATQSEDGRKQGLRAFIYPNSGMWRPFFIIDNTLVDLWSATGDFVWDEQAGTLTGSFKDGTFLYRGQEHVVASTSFSVTLDR